MRNCRSNGRFYVLMADFTMGNGIFYRNGVNCGECDVLMTHSRESDVLTTHSLTSHFIGETSEVSNSYATQQCAKLLISSLRLNRPDTHTHTWLQRGPGRRPRQLPLRRRPSLRRRRQRVRGDGTRCTRRRTGRGLEFGISPSVTN